LRCGSENEVTARKIVLLKKYFFGRGAVDDKKGCDTIVPVVGGKPKRLNLKPVL
jgi:hypothetical protein